MAKNCHLLAQFVPTPNLTPATQMPIMASVTGNQKNQAKSLIKFCFIPLQIYKIYKISGGFGVNIKL